MTQRAMSISGLALPIIKACEGCRLKAYPDPGTGDRPYTIGYGHTGKDVFLGLTISQERAEELLIGDLELTIRGIRGMLKVSIPDNQVAALASFAYNVGLGNLLKSKLLRLINAQDFKSASNEFDRWTRSGGKVLAGLVKRRRSEKELFLS